MRDPVTLEYIARQKIDGLLAEGMRSQAVRRAGIRPEGAGGLMRRLIQRLSLRKLSKQERGVQPAGGEELRPEAGSL